MVRHEARFRLYEELNDFLPTSKRKTTFPYAFAGSPSVKDALEAIGVPHVEIDLIIVNGESVGFDYKLRDGDRVAVYPTFESLDISPVTRLRPKPLRSPAFVVDVHLGKLARLLRLLGLDTAFDRELSPPEIRRIARLERRIILTRSRMLLRACDVTHGYWIRSICPREQAREVLHRFDLRRNLVPFTRCMACNGVLQPVSKDKIRNRLLPATAKYFREFRQCSRCSKVYWKGSHYQKLTALVAQLLEESDSGCFIDWRVPGWV